MSGSKSDKIKELFKLIQKRHKHAPAVAPRNVLEHLLYAALLENASFEAADSSFAVLEHHYIDWNEVRVATSRELADTFPLLPDPLLAGERVRRTLQAVFEMLYVFDLESLKKKNINLALADLRKIPACTRFMADYTNRMAFDGHVIPLDEASLRIFRLLGLAQVNKDRTQEDVPGLERAIPKTQGVVSGMLLHHFAAQFYGDREGSELRSILKVIDPEVVRRDMTPPTLVVASVSVPVSFPSVLSPMRGTKGAFIAEEDDEAPDEHEDRGAEIDFVDGVPFGPVADDEPFNRQLYAGSDSDEAVGHKLRNVKTTTKKAGPLKNPASPSLPKTVPARTEKRSGKSAASKSGKPLSGTKPTSLPKSTKSVNLPTSSHNVKAAPQSVSSKSPAKPTIKKAGKVAVSKTKAGKPAPKTISSKPSPKAATKNTARPASPEKKKSSLKPAGGKPIGKPPHPRPASGKTKSSNQGGKKQSADKSTIRKLREKKPR